MGGHDEALMWNAEVPQHSRCFAHGVPVRATAHDDRNDWAGGVHPMVRTGPEWI